MKGPSVPPEIVALAEERARARAAHDWRAADALKARLVSAGWTIVDDGLDFRVRPALPPDIEYAGRLLYGSPDSVPSRTAEPDAPWASIVLIAGAASVAATLAALQQHGPADSQFLVVAPREVGPGELAGASEVIWTATAFTAGQALRSALRRATGEVVVVLQAGLLPAGDIVVPLRAALEDPAVALAGAAGLRSLDLQHWQAASGDVTALSEACYAFRRRDALAREAPDDRLQLARGVATWWSLLLRDEEPPRHPRRAVVVDLPLAPRDVASQGIPVPGTRQARRDAYRIADRFRGRTWLAAADPGVERVPGHGTDGHDQGEDAHEGGDTSQLA